jgi:hypothetical protein
LQASGQSSVPPNAPQSAQLKGLQNAQPSELQNEPWSVSGSGRWNVRASGQLSVWPKGRRNAQLRGWWSGQQNEQQSGRWSVQVGRKMLTTVGGLVDCWVLEFSFFSTHPDLASSAPDKSFANTLPAVLIYWQKLSCVSLSYN